MKYKDKPESAGYYWLKNMLSAAPARIVEVWGYEVGGALFTNDDGGASLDDERYETCKWLGPLVEPHSIFGDER